MLSFNPLTSFKYLISRFKFFSIKHNKISSLCRSYTVKIWSFLVSLVSGYFWVGMTEPSMEADGHSLKTKPNEWPVPAWMEPLPHVGLTHAMKHLLHLSRAKDWSITRPHNSITDVKWWMDWWSLFFCCESTRLQHTCHLLFDPLWQTDTQSSLRLLLLYFLVK